VWRDAARSWLAHPGPVDLAALRAGVALNAGPANGRVQWTVASARILAELDAAAGRATQVEDAAAIDTAAPGMSAIDSP
jgi:hypothetical protein